MPQGSPQRNLSVCFSEAASTSRPPFQTSPSLIIIIVILVNRTRLIFLPRSIRDIPTLFPIFQTSVRCFCTFHDIPMWCLKINKTETRLERTRLVIFKDHMEYIRNNSIDYSIWLHRKIPVIPELSTQQFQFFNRIMGAECRRSDGQLFAQNLVRVTSFEIRVTAVLSRSSLRVSLIRSTEHPGTRSSKSPLDQPFKNARKKTTRQNARWKKVSLGGKLRLERIFLN